ncbi:hypothetical protein RI049_09670 [Cedecea neteri]|uniref:hypothetical protein n=1 Tax=Cedecea neteri TaxID=158822 RepID=UPI002AA6EA10|nr:hypothetical protein [Cedecea neteri]WPU24981.1 hypothetical protein RI049_09670 [Cedecea neteri]
MKLYHGTSSTAAISIEECGFILKDIERTYGPNGELPTTDGYVYLTDHPGYAAYMANKEALFKKSDFFVVYKIDVDETLLKADIDELKYVCDLSESDAKKCTSYDSLKLSRSCCIPKNLAIGIDVKRKVTLPFSGNYSSPHIKLSREVICLRRAGQEEQALAILNSFGWQNLL